MNNKVTVGYRIDKGVALLPPTGTDKLLTGRLTGQIVPVNREEKIDNS